MGGSVTNFAQTSVVTRPSPTIWADCPLRELIDQGNGYFFHSDFLGGAVTATVLPSIAVIPGMSIDADTDTIAAYVAGRVGGFLDIETDADDDDAFAAHSEPLGPITRGSGKKFWFEVAVELGDVTMDGGIFVGIVEEAGATRDVIANGATALVGESLIGFQVSSGDPNAVDIVYKKDGGTVVVVASDVTNSTALASDDRASLVNDTAVKLGFRYDGRDTLRFYVNGVRVATQDVDITVDQTKNYAAIIAIKTGATAAESFAFDFLRFAFKDTN